MFAAPLLAPIFTPKANRRKNHSHASASLTGAALLCCLLFSLSTLAVAEDATTNTAPAAQETSPVPAASPDENMTQTTDDSEQQKGRVARAIFTSAIVDREPVDNLNTVSGDAQRVFFFTDLRDLAGQIVTHRWEYNDKVMAEVMFKVGNGARWRVYSSKNLLPEWTGQWKVIVSNEAGLPLNTSEFEYSAEMTDKAPTETTATTSP